MSIKLVDIDDSEVPNAEQYGRFNNCPPNLKEISDDEFFRMLTMGTPSYMMYKQCFDHSVYSWLGLHMYIFYDGNGVAIGELPTVHNGTYRDRKFYSFALCEHKWESVPEESRMCYHVSRCKKCDIKRTIDSSD